MNPPKHATVAFTERQQQAALLSVAVARINSEPEEPQHVAEAFERVLEIAAASPGGWNSLVHFLEQSRSRDDILAFCKAFTSIVAIGERQARALDEDEIIEPVHDFDTLEVIA